jgi:hypothetical protein
MNTMQARAAEFLKRVRDVSMVSETADFGLNARGLRDYVRYNPASRGQILPG